MVPSTSLALDHLVFQYCHGREGITGILQMTLRNVKLLLLKCVHVYTPNAYSYKQRRQCQNCQNKSRFKHRLYAPYSETTSQINFGSSIYTSKFYFVRFRLVGLRASRLNYLYSSCVKNMNLSDNTLFYEAQFVQTVQFSSYSMAHLDFQCIISALLCLFVSTWVI